MGASWRRKTTTYFFRHMVFDTEDLVTGPHDVVAITVSYTRVCETSAGWLRSIYPSLGLRQFFGDFTMGQWRHN